jgi:hypothetical protein
MILLLATCVPATRPAEPTPTIEATPTIEPAPAADAPKPPAGVAPNNVAVHCYDDRLGVVVLPSFGTSVYGHVCDLPDRIIVVDGGRVTSIARPGLARTTAPIARQEGRSYTCGGPGQGHVGCSVVYRRYWSHSLGIHYVEFGTNQGNVLGDDGNGSKVEYCREASHYQVIATCSTAKRFAVVKYLEPDYNEPQACYHLRVWLWEGRDKIATELEGDVDRAASAGDRWTFRFPAERGVALAFERWQDPAFMRRVARRATLEVGGDREDCVAFRLSTWL